MKNKVKCSVVFELSEDGKSAIEINGTLGDLIKVMASAVVQMAASVNASPMGIACDIGEKAFMMHLKDELEREEITSEY